MPDPVFLWVEVEGGQVHNHAEVPRESPTVRGFISLLAHSLDGVAPEEVARILDDLLDQLGLSETLGMTRTQGLTAILHRIKRSVAAATASLVSIAYVGVTRNLTAATTSREPGGRGHPSRECGAP
ncbi:MAG: SufE family protein [Gammaproteobacteria bacterium]